MGRHNRGNRSSGCEAGGRRARPRTFLWRPDQERRELPRVRVDVAGRAAETEQVQRPAIAFASFVRPAPTRTTPIPPFACRLVRKSF